MTSMVDLAQALVKSARVTVAPKAADVFARPLPVRAAVDVAPTPDEEAGAVLVQAVRDARVIDAAWGRAAFRRALEAYDRALQREDF